MKILLVDDMEITRIIHKNILINFGQVDIAKDGIEAVQKVLASYNMNRSYDVILLDIIMPKSSGFHALENIRKYENVNNINNKIKIIIVSSLDKKDDIEKAKELGADEVLIKPIDRIIIKDIFKKLGIDKV